MADECILNTYDYQVTLPIDSSSPPINFFQVIFNCNGVEYTSPIMNSADAALAWALDILSEFGTWTLSGDTLTVSDTTCETGSLVYRLGEDSEVEGCTNPDSSNFNYRATVDDGSCVGAVTPHGGCTNPDASNYDATANFDDGTCEFASSMTVFDTAAKEAIQTKIGANIFETDVDQFASWTTRAQAIDFQTYFYTPVSAAMNNSHANTLNTFLSNVGATVGVFYPIRNDAVVAAFPTFLDWLISKFNPVFIQLDQETISGTTLTNASYISRSQQVVGYTAIPCSWDCGLMYKNNGNTTDRNNALAPLTAPPSLGRQYEQIQDRISYDATDQNYNLSALNNYFNNLLPSYVTAFFAKFIHLTKEVILQWQNADFDDPIELPDVLDNWTISKMAEFTLSNTSSFKYLFWMQASNLFHGTLKREYTSIQRIAPAFGFAYTLPITLPFSGVSGRAFTDGANSFAIIINNQTATQQTISKANITIPTKTIPGLFTRSTGWGNSLSGAIQNETVSEASIIVRPYSSSYVTFTTA